MRRRYGPPRDLRLQSEAKAEESVPAARGVQGHTAQSMGHVKPRGCARGHGASVTPTLRRDAQSTQLADRKTARRSGSTMSLAAVRLPTPAGDVPTGSYVLSPTPAPFESACTLSTPLAVTRR